MGGVRRAWRLAWRNPTIPPNFLSAMKQKNHKKKYPRMYCTWNRIARQSLLMSFLIICYLHDCTVYIYVIGLYFVRKPQSLFKTVSLTFQSSKRQVRKFSRISFTNTTLLYRTLFPRRIICANRKKDSDLVFHKKPSFIFLSPSS